tara:strand:+ start:226 stop:597 length:372 start_codon:yes stop_codon:yes gene_type:complete
MSRARNLSRLGNPSVLSVSTDNNVGVNSTSPVEKLNVVGVVSATSFFGNGAGLTGIANTANITSDSIVVVGVVTATTFAGSGADLTSLPSSQLSGALPALDGSALTNLNIPAGFNELDAALFN